MHQKRARGCYTKDAGSILEVRVRVRSAVPGAGSRPHEGSDTDETYSPNSGGGQRVHDILLYVPHLLSCSPSLSFPPKLGLKITSAPGFRQEHDILRDVVHTRAVGGYDHFDPRPAE